MRIRDSKTGAKLNFSYQNRIGASLMVGGEESAPVLFDWECEETQEFYDTLEDQLSTNLADFQTSGGRYLFKVGSSEVTITDPYGCKIHVFTQDVPHLFALLTHLFS